ncbi:MAG: Clp protease ClpP [Verrucomicrobia bacterium]|nr:Clp protease ClpP [Verrucomicrobiota bacterium]
MNTWFSVTRRTDTARLYIFGEIGSFGCGSQQVLAQLDGVNGVELVLDSPGGSSCDALEIYDRLVKLDTSVTIHRAYSAAAVLAQSGKVRRILSTGRMMVHPAIDFVAGTSARLRERAESLDTFNQRLAEIFAARTGQPVSVAAHWHSGPDFYFNAQEALAAGLADEIIEPPSLPVSATPSESTPAEPGPTEDEAFTLDFLRAIGPLRVGSRPRFERELRAWFSGVREA